MRSANRECTHDSKRIQGVQANDKSCDTRTRLNMFIGHDTEPVARGPQKMIMQ